MPTGLPDFSYPYAGLSVGIGTVSVDGVIGTYTSEKVDCTAGNRVRTLPSSAAQKGVRYKVQKFDATANTLTVQVSGSDTIKCSSGMVTSITIYTQAGFIWLESDGLGGWWEG